ncbi:MAG TPA: hypothetical protein VGL94_01520 [Ktedonobacteraceae bacterium]
MTTEDLKREKSRVNVDDVINALAARSRPDLLMLGFYFASLVFTDEEDKQWLRERLSEVQEIVEGSCLYQLNIQKGFEEGLEKGREQGLLQQTAIRIVAARFPELEQFATPIIKQITDLKQVEKLSIELSIASSQERAKDFLLSPVSVD